MQECVCMWNYVCVYDREHKGCVYSTCPHALVCWKGQMDKREEHIRKKKKKKRMIAEEKRRGNGEREGTWSRNASVALQPATSHHGASADRWMQESPIIEKMLGHKHPDEREELLHVRQCVRTAAAAAVVMAAAAAGSQGSAASTTTTHHEDLTQTQSAELKKKPAWGLIYLSKTGWLFGFTKHASILLPWKLVPWVWPYYPRWLILPIHLVSFAAFVLCS